MVTPWVHWPVSWAEAATVSLGSGIRSLSPVLSEVEFAGLERERVSDCSAEHDLGGAEAGDGAGVVPGVGLSKAACLLIILGPSPKIKNSSGIGYINQLKPVKTSPLEI